MIKILLFAAFAVSIVSCKSTPVPHFSEVEPNYRAPANDSSQIMFLKSCTQNPFSAKDNASWKMPTNMYDCDLSHVEGKTNSVFTAMVNFSTIEPIVSSSNPKVEKVKGSYGTEVTKITFIPEIKIEGRSSFSYVDFIDYKMMQITSGGKYAQPALSDFITRVAESLAVGLCPQFQWTKRDTYMVSQAAFNKESETIAAIQLQLNQITQKVGKASVVLTELSSEEAWVKGPASYYSVTNSDRIKKLMFGPYSTPILCR